METHKTTHWQEKAGLGFILLLSAFLRLFHLDNSGFGNTYYAATVRSMLVSWHNFIYDSYDPAGFVTVDKPPVAFWIQALSAKLLGYSAFHIMLPQALEGLVSVLLVYHLVKRRFDGWASLLAALAMGLGPVCVAVDRSNNVDGCLVMVLLFAAWAMILAVEKGSLGFLSLAMALVGIGFNVKMVISFIILPAFYLLYLFGPDIPRKKRLRDLTAASLVLAVSALSWPLFVDLTPAKDRPFVGSTQDNSMVGLSLGWNGLNKLIGVRGMPGASGATGTAFQNQNLDRRQGWNDGEAGPGPLRLADRNLAGQILWFLPLALAGFAAAWRTKAGKGPIQAGRLSLCIWGGWFFTYALVFSFMKAGVHLFYIVTLAPPLAALTGIGTRALWLDLTEGKPVLLLTGLLATAVWQGTIVYQYPDWRGFLLPIFIPAILIAAAGLWLAGQGLIRKGRSDRWGPPALGLGMAALFLNPTFWCLGPVLGHGEPVADPDVISNRSRRTMGNWGGDLNREEAVAKLTNFLRSQKHGEYLLAAPNSQAVSPIIIQTGDPVIALGGYSGADPTMTVDEFSQKVKEGNIRYFLLSEPEMAGGGGNGLQQQIVEWVLKNGKPVDLSLWRIALANHPTGNRGNMRRFVGGRDLMLYDLMPQQN